jgi:hypothetical protein
MGGNKWAADFEATACKMFLCSFLPMRPKKKQKEKKVLLPTGVSKSAAHTVLIGRT